MRLALSRAIDKELPSLASGLGRDQESGLDLVRVAAIIESTSQDILRQSVEAARAGGASWAHIGEVLGISRHAAHQRFGGGGGEGDGGPLIWRIEGLTAFDEMEILAELGQQGWHSIGYGAGYHDLVRDTVQWEHERVVFARPSVRRAHEGWNLIGEGWFPWTYFARPTTRPALP